MKKARFQTEFQLEAWNVQTLKSPSSTTLWTSIC